MRATAGFTRFDAVAGLWLEPQRHEWIVEARLRAEVPAHADEARLLSKFRAAAENVSAGVLGLGGYRSSYSGAGDRQEGERGRHEQYGVAEADLLEELRNPASRAWLRLPLDVVSLFCGGLCSDAS